MTTTPPENTEDVQGQDPPVDQPETGGPQEDPAGPVVDDSDEDSENVNEDALQAKWGDARDPAGDGEDVDAKTAGYQEDDQADDGDSK